jgi:hypothetical protein
VADSNPIGSTKKARVAFTLTPESKHESLIYRSTQHVANFAIDGQLSELLLSNAEVHSSLLEPPVLTAKAWRCAKNASANEYGTGRAHFA